MQHFMIVQFMSSVANNKTTIKPFYLQHSFHNFFSHGKVSHNPPQEELGNLPTFQTTWNGVIDPIPQSWPRLCLLVPFTPSFCIIAASIVWHLPIQVRETLASLTALIKKSQQLKIPPENSISGTDTPGAAAAALCSAAPCR